MQQYLPVCFDFWQKDLINDYDYKTDRLTLNFSNGVMDFCVRTNGEAMRGFMTVFSQYTLLSQQSFKPNVMWIRSKVTITLNGLDDERDQLSLSECSLNGAINFHIRLQKTTYNL